MTFALLWNILEAGLALYYPNSTPPTVSSVGGMTMTPTKISSPLVLFIPRSKGSLTRPVLPDASISTSRSTPRATPQPINFHLNPYSPVQSPWDASEPLLHSQAHRIPPLTPPSSTGLYFDPSSPASPARIGQPPQQIQAQEGSNAPGGDFVLIDREEKEWVENVWRGVRGKAGRLGL